MPLVQTHQTQQAMTHECPRCGLTVTWWLSALYFDDTITPPPCPNCGTVESLRVAIPDHEVGIGTHPGSLLGTVFADTHGIVTEHLSGYTLHQQQVATRLRHRELRAAIQAAQQGQHTVS